MLESLSDPATWSALLSLTAMEVVLGVDNLVFIAILAGKLPVERRRRVTRLGIGIALVMRIGLIFAISWIMGLTTVLFRVAGHGFTGRHLVLLAGGLFLMVKATNEIYSKVERADHAPKEGRALRGGAMVVAQIVAVDLVFSVDSVITAVGMVDEIWVMVVAMLVAVVSMLAFASPIGTFVEKHPSMKILALAFLLLIGVMLVAESLGQHIPKGYIYFAMAFSLGIEVLNMRFRRKDVAVTAPTPAAGA